jgi:four helix bundle protein
MENKEFARILEERTKHFAIRVIRFSAGMPYTPEFKVIRNQLTKSASSVGANYREANRARSTADFRSRIRVCESEANETVYWLEILEEILPEHSSDLHPILSEARELLSIFTSISRNTKTQ